MRYSASEKLEFIRLVEESTLPMRRTLDKDRHPHATFYCWYDLYQICGPEALDDRCPRPDRVPERIVELALDEPCVIAEAIGRALHRHRKLFCLGGIGLSVTQGSRSDR
jgi:hypothetical protein